MRVVTPPKSLDGISGHLGRRRHLRERSAVRPPEPKRPVGAARDLIALLVDGAVVPPAEQREVRERRGPSLGPVMDVMALAKAHPAAGEAATPVPMVERPP